MLLTRSLLAVLGGVLLAGVATPALADQVPYRDACSFADERIDESSGLADGSRVLYTVNDSGDGPFVYSVDKLSCATVAVTEYSEGGVVDVEALAAEREKWLWVGDIGDNDADRSSVDVYRLPLGELGKDSVEATRFSLAYPDAPHDAETLLVHPTTGQMYVITKAVFGAGLYAAPSQLARDRINRMTRVETVPGLITDGAFYPGGDYLLLRSYQHAMLYSFPALELVRRLELPEQEQGEAVTISRIGQVYISSEGAHASVLELFLPELPVATPTADSSPQSSVPPRGPGNEADDQATAGGSDSLLSLAAFVVVLAFTGYGVFTVFRPRGRRSR